MALQKQQKEQIRSLSNVLTIQSGFTLSFLASTIWAAWSLQLGLRKMWESPSEEDVVARFGPHFKEPSYIVNGIFNWAVGGPWVNQTFAKSFMMMEGCVVFCDVLVGTVFLTLALPLFLLMFHIPGCRSESSSGLKVRVKIWCFLAWCTQLVYYSSFAVDSANMIFVLPPEVHGVGYRTMGLRYLISVIPLTHVVFSFLYYRRLHNAQGGKEIKDVEKDEVPPGPFKRFNRVCSCTEWGCHIFLLIGFIMFNIIMLSIFMIDLRTVVTKPE